MKKHKNKIIAGIIIICALAVAFWYGGNAPGLRGWTPGSEEKVTTVQSSEPVREEKTESTQSSPEKTISSSKDETDNETYSDDRGIVVNEATGKDKYETDPVPEGKPVPVEPQDIVVSNKEFTCTLSVRCDTILSNINQLDSGKIDIVPKDGMIFAEKTVTFYEGESVFNVLVREMKRNKIHIEYEMSPIYETAYIKGIANIYEFDCGDLSGWLYKVNGQVPNVGCSLYYLNDGDVVELVYTCEMGKDLE